MSLSCHPAPRPRPSPRLAAGSSATPAAVCTQRLLLQVALPAVEPKAKATIQGKARQGVAEGQRCQEELRTGQERTSLLLEGADGWEEAPSAQAQLGKRKHRALWHPHSPAHSFLWLDDVLPSYFSWDFFALSNLFAKASHIVPRHLTRP